MRAVVQRVSRAQVSVKGEITGQIGPGVLVLLGVGRDDTQADASYLAQKIAALRIFEDDHGKMNRSILEIGGSVLAVSQFTLYADVRRGNRPSFDAAAPAEKARQLYELFVDQIRAAGVVCETGRFQEMMRVELANEGPVTVLLDSGKTF
ncbi:MAG: D-aminoacyl-tRNA deacylase [Candidatus Sulfotelmatobacter sp.]